MTDCFGKTAAVHTGGVVGVSGESCQRTCAEARGVRGSVNLACLSASDDLRIITQSLLQNHSLPPVLLECRFWFMLCQRSLT